MQRFLYIPNLLRMQNCIMFTLCLVVCAVTLLLAPQAQSQLVTRHENAVVSMTVTSVETSPGTSGWHYLTTNVHFQNLTKKPLILGVEASKVSATDDKRNSYSGTTVRGIGEIAGTRIDPKFALPPEGGGDALFEMRWRADRSIIFGTTFDLTLPVRVILPLEGGQVKLSTEYLMTFTGLTTGYIAAPTDAQSLPANTVNAGPFTVQITRLTPSTSANRRWHTATLAARIQNTSGKPLVLAYESASSYGIDDQGNRYGYGTTGTHDMSVKGIGMVTSLNADPQLVLAPGESRDVQFSAVRALNRGNVGKQLTYYVALAQLEVFPSKQIRTVRQYSLAFPRMSGLN